MLILKECWNSSNFIDNFLTYTLQQAETHIRKNYFNKSMTFKCFCNISYYIINSLNKT